MLCLDISPKKNLSKKCTMTSSSIAKETLKHLKKKFTPHHNGALLDPVESVVQQIFQDHNPSFLKEHMM